MKIGVLTLMVFVSASVLAQSDNKSVTKVSGVSLGIHYAPTFYSNNEPYHGNSGFTPIGLGASCGIYLSPHLFFEFSLDYRHVESEWYKRVWDAGISWKTKTTLWPIAFQLKYFFSETKVSVYGSGGVLIVPTKFRHEQVSNDPHYYNNLYDERPLLFGFAVGIGLQYMVARDRWLFIEPQYNYLFSERNIYLMNFKVGLRRHFPQW